MNDTFQWQCPFCHTEYSMLWQADYRFQVVYCSTCMAQIILELVISVSGAKSHDQIIGEALFRK